MTLIALTRDVSPSLGHCELTHLAREPIDVDRARLQHEAYERALAGCGCRVERLPELPASPDAVFVEDVAVVVDEHAVITRPGAESRRAETASAMEALASYRSLTTIDPPGTLDGGDVLRLGRRVFVGRSSRSNDAGVDALRAALEPFGYLVQSVELEGCLHLKSAATEVAPGVVLVNPAWLEALGIRVIPIDLSELAKAEGAVTCCSLIFRGY